ncbi:MAG: thermonuclease family protein [Bacilli bacterium]|nr:thermonuclease family protein [Bacilli bacterium]
MKFRTKLFALVLTIFTIICLVGCGGDTPDGSKIDLTGSRTKYTDTLEISKMPTSTSTLDVDGVSFAEVTKYVDGDTTYFTTLLSTGKEDISVRYLGLDTPESTYKVEPWGIAAAKFTKEKLKNAESVILQADPTGLFDSNSRYLAYVWYRNSATEPYRMLNLELVEEGYSPAKGLTGTIYMQTFYDANSRAQAFKDRTNGEQDPTYDYSAQGKKYTLKQIIDEFGTPEAISSEEFKGTKVYIEGLVTRKLGISSAYIEQVNEGYYTVDEDGNEVFVEGDGKKYGVYIYGGFEENLKLAEGNYIITNANISYHNGALQVVGVANHRIEVESTGNVVEPTVLTSQDWQNLDVSMSCRLIKLDTLKVVGGKDDENTEAYTIYTETPDGVRVNIRIDANVALKVTGIIKNKTWATFEGCTFTNVVGVVQPYYDGYQLMVMNLQDLGYQK